MIVQYLNRLFAICLSGIFIHMRDASCFENLMQVSTSFASLDQGYTGMYTLCDLWAN